MTKKMRISFYICIAFLLTVVFFTAGFLVYFHGTMPPVDPSAADSAAAPLQSTPKNIAFGDLLSLGLIGAVLIIIVFLIAKS